MTTIGNHALSRRTLGKVFGGAAATGILAHRAGPALAQATPVAGPPAVTATAVADAITQLESLIPDILASSGVPGLSVGIVFQDEIVYAKGFGVRSVDAPDLVDTETVFQLASVSKTLASTTVASVVSSGEITWDDRVQSHLADFELSDSWITHEVTLRDCFSHRTGMPGTAGDNLEALGFNRSEIIHRMRDLNLTGQFRQTFSYSNFGVTLGAEAAAEAVGVAWEDLAEERIYTPLGMSSTSSRYADFIERANRAALHIPVDGVWMQKFEHQPDVQAPAGGVSSNVVDMTQWIRMLLGNGTLDGTHYIKADVLRDTWTPQIVSGLDPTTGNTGFYGLAWVVSYDRDGRISLSHAGAFSVGARTLVSLIPAEQLGIVVLCNAFPTGLPEEIAYSFFDFVHYGALSQDWSALWGGYYDSIWEGFTTPSPELATLPASPTAPLTSDAYVGSYTNDYFGTLRITAEGDALTMEIGTTPLQLPLAHWDRDVFTFNPVPEGPDVKATVDFLVDDTSQASLIRIDAFNGYGQGTFVRAAQAG